MYKIDKILKFYQQLNKEIWLADDDPLGLKHVGANNVT